MSHLHSRTFGTPTPHARLKRTRQCTDKPAVIRPLLKWAGGKRQLLPLLRELYPAGFDRYIEPFLGSGAVFFDLQGAGLLDGRRTRLADVNPDLIDCYRVVRDRPDAVIGALSALADEHRARGSACYYDVRDERFNPRRLARAESNGTPAGDGWTPDLAAMLIYLNRTGFNGLFRLNRRGEFNVPAGRYVNPRICEPDHLRHVAGAFGAAGVTLEHGGFDDLLADAGAGDFVYCDPPYAPLSRTASFARYTSTGFTPHDHARLQRAVTAAASRGAIVVLSNSSAPEIVASYASAAPRKAGLRVRRVPARRAINSRASARGPVDELIITNSPGLRRLDTLQPAMLRASLQRRRRTA